MKNAFLPLLQRFRERYVPKWSLPIPLLVTCLILLLLNSFQAKAALVSGTLTVDPTTNSPSATVFKDLNSVITYLTSASARTDLGTANSAPFGVSGPVVININAGTYYEQVIIPAISGTSSVNSITLKGAGVLNTIINCTTATTSARHTIRLNSTSYIIIRDLSIRNESPSFAWPLHIMGSSSNCVISNCAINFGNTSLNTLASDNYVSVVMNNNASSPSTAGTFANIDIDSNAIYGGHYSLYVAGSAATSTGIRIRYNTCDSANRYGLYFSGVGEIKCLNNKIRNRFISSGVTDGAGIWLQSCSPAAGSGKYHEISNNQVSNAECYGLNLNFCTTLAAPAKSIISNNYFAGGFRNANPYGIYINNSSNGNSWNVYHNSVLLDNQAVGSTSGAFFASMCCTATDQMDVRNNHFIVGNPASSSLPLFVQSWGFGSWATQFNYNNYFKKGQTNSTTLINLTGSLFNASNITTAGGTIYNVNSVSKDPVFVSNTNLATLTPCNNGISLAGFTMDITGVTRAGTPDIGAYEYAATANDIGITGITSPAVPAGPGNANVTATLNNFGTSALTSATVSYSVNGGAPVTQAWTGNLAACASTAITFSGAQALALTNGTSYSLKVFTSNPNGSADGNTNNDTAFATTFSTALSGNYTIDAAGSGPNNFTTFNTAVAALAAGGVSGPVTFTIAAGTYNEQVLIPAIPNASSVNTVTFTGGNGNAATRVLTYAGTAVAPHTFKIENASYINIYNLSIIGTGSTNGWPLHLQNANNVNVKRNIITFTGSGLSSASQNFIGVVANSSASLLNSNGYISYLTIEDNTISGGHAGVYVYGISNTASSYHYYTGNNINNCSNYGIYDYYVYTDIDIRNNTIALRTGNTTGQGIYVFAAQSVTATMDVAGNTVKDAGQYGIYIANYSGSAASPLNVTNNMCGGGFNTASANGIYLANSSFVNVWFNSVNLDAASQGISYAALYLSGISNLDVRNNNLVVSGTSSTGLAFLSQSCTFLNLNYNNYYRYVNPVQLININGAFYSSTNLFGASGYNINSRSVDPEYINAKNLHTSLRCNTGIEIPGYTQDADGNTRSNPPGLGADENTTTSLTNDLSVELIASPTVPAGPGSQDIRVQIRNNGSNTITSANISYKVNANTAVTQVWTGSLAPCATEMVTFTGSNQFNFLPSTAYTLLAYCDQPNGSADNALNNDTARLTIVATGISGNFTIDGSIPASATNFQNFSTAISAMTANGISGPVNFTVAPATYNVQVIIPVIPGASSANTVTFNGGTGNAANVIVSFSGATSARHTIRIDGYWIRIRNMSILGTGTFAWPVHINSGASNVQVRNCIINCTQALSSQTSANFTGIAITSSSTALSGAHFASNIDIDSNTIINGWYGISFYGSGSLGTNPGVNIRKNRIDSAGVYAISLNYTSGCVINDNTISMRVGNGASTSSYGISLTGCMTTASDNIQVNRNKVTGSTQYGIYLSSAGGSATTQRAQLINNSVGGGFTSASSSGIYFTTATYWDVLFNSVNIDNAATSTTQCIYLATSSPTFNDIRNNNLAVTHTGASGAVCYRSANGATVNTLNYNNYYKAGAGASTTIISVLGTAFTPSTFTGANGGGANSIAQNTSFTSSTNLLPTASTNKGLTLSSVSTDIAGTYRNIPPDLGAYEIPSTAPVDLAVIRLNSPDTTLPVGSYNVSVTVRNFGVNPVTSFNLRHTVNGSNLQDTAITGINLAPNSTLDVNMGAGKQASFTLMANTLKVYVYQPNGSSDAWAANDSIVIGPRYPSMSGSYTIDPLGSGPLNFLSFNAAATAINSGGVSGAVTFNVASATFNEQVVFGAISGVSAINTVRFIGNGTANTTLNFAGAVAPNQHTLRLNGSSWLSFENMTISGGGTSSNWVAHLLNTTNCTIKKCKITVPVTATSGAFIGILCNNSTATNGETTASTVVNNNMIDSNVIENGYCGLMISSNTGTNLNYVRGNIFTNVVYNAAYFYSTQAFKFTGNTVTMRTGISNSIAINGVSASAAAPLFSEIKNNTITNTGANGISFNSVNGSNGSAYGEIVNNMIGGGFFNTTGSGISLSSCSNWRIWHNSINYDAVGSSSALNLVNGSNNDIRNNIFSIRNTAATLAIPVVLNPASAASAFNYNNLYNAAGPNLVNIGGTIYTASGLNGTFPNGGGLNSRNMNPAFTSSLNLHISEACMNGDNLGVSTDIEGNTRGTTPDMGADEMTAVPGLDASISKINAPVFPFTSGTQPVNITVQNNGNTTLTALTLSYSVNGSAAVSESWTGSLASCDTMNFTFAGTYSFTSGPNVVKVYVDAPNAGTDANNSNDTVSTAALCTSLNGTYTINPAGAGATNFTSFAAAISALNCSGVTGPVVFNVANGTYNEQINLGVIQGASASNTISIQSASGNAGSVTVSFTPGVENYVMNLNGTDYLTVKNITLYNASTSSGYYNVLQVGNSATNNTFRGCIFTNATPVSGILVLATSSSDHYNTFTSNTFSGASYGISWQGNTSSPLVYPLNLVIDSNTFNNQYNYGMYVYYCNGTRIRNNTISTTSTTNYYGIQATYVYQSGQILNNSVNVNSTSTSYGINLTGFNNGGNASLRGLVANNLIRVSTGTANAYGLYIDQSMNYTDVIHNTIHAINSGAGVAFAANINSGTSGYVTDYCNFVNNIFQANTASNSSYAFFHNSSAFNNSVLNYNNYFTSAGNVARFTGNVQATLQSWKTANAAYNVNSLSKRIAFAGSDLHLSAPCLDNIGSNAFVSLVDKDIDGQTRNATTPDIGADEFTALAYDVKVSRITSPLGYNASAQTVKAWLVNNGSNTITSAQLAYNINGGAAVSEIISSLSIAACDSAEVTFVTPISTPTGYTMLQVFAAGSINGSNADGNGQNDSAGLIFCTSLSGNFTINAAVSNSSTNFTSFANAVGAMKSCGLTGPVIFTVAPGTYTEQITIANIPGASAVNTITFDGVDSSNRIIQYNLAGNTNRHVIMIDSCRNVTIKNFRIVNNSPNYGWGIHVRGTTAVNHSDFVTIRKCSFVLPLTTSSNYAGVVSSNSFTSSSTATNYVQNLTIDSNTFTGAYYGVSINGVSTAVRSFANTIQNNVFANMYVNAIYAQHTSDLKISRNSMTNIGRSTGVNTSPQAIYLLYADSFEVTKNKIFGLPGGSGLYTTNSAGVSASPNLIANNMMQVGEGSNASQVVFLSTSPFTSLYYNSLYSTTAATNTSNCALYAASSNSLISVNNNYTTLYNTANYMSYFPSTTVTQSDYNNYYGGYYYGNGYLTLTAFKNSLHTGNDANSKNINPGYVSISDLHTPTTTALDSSGLTVLAVADDIDGDLRSNIKPDIGADEFSAPKENTGVIAIINPGNPITAGPNEVHVVIRNFGATTLTSDSVIYQVGTTVHRRLWTGSLATNAVDTIRFTANSGTGNSDQRYVFPSGSSTIKAWTAYPNGLADVTNQDDTITAVVCTGYGGTYTINPAGSGPNNFTSFAAAANALQCGLTAPVIINVAPGTYNEQFVINPIPGSNSTNTVLFTSANGNAASVVVQNNSPAVNNYVVRLAGADYVTFDKLTFTALNATYGIVMDITTYNALDKPGNISITNCTINGSAQNTTQTNNLVNAAVETPNLVITGNTFTKGSYAVYYTGSSSYPYTIGVRISNNVFGTSTADAPYYAGINASYTRGVVIENNQFTGPAYIGYNAISLSSCTGKVKVNMNKITATGGGTGLTFTFINTSNEPDSAEVMNNSIAIGGTSSATGIYLQYCGNMNIYHNSVNIYSTSASTYAMRTYGVGSSYTKNRLQNNQLVSASGFALYLEGNNTANAAATLQLCNYNNLYTGGTNLAYITTTGNIANLAAFRNVVSTGSDANSVSGDPVFTSSTNLIPTSCKPNAAGIALVQVSTDINGVTRKAIPDMGAFEFTPALAVPVVTSPVNLCYGSTATALTAAAANTKLWFTAASGGAGTSTAIVPNTLTRISQTYYVADSSATSGCISNRAAITVNIDTAVAGNTISSAQSVCSGSAVANLTGSTPSGGNGNFTYLWLSSTTSATTGFDAASGINNTLGYEPGTPTATTWYKRVVTSGACGNDTSAAVQITVTLPVSANTISSLPQTICSGSTPAVLTASAPAGGNGSFAYIWISSTTSASSGFTAASGTNDTNGYAPGSLTSSTWFRRIVSSGSCNADTSAAVTVTVNTAITNNGISTAQSICSGSTPNALSGTTPAGGNGTSYAYAWISSSTNAATGYAAAGGTDNASGYSPFSLISNTWFRRIVSSGACNADTSAAIQITVTSPVSNNSITSGTQSICSGSTPTALTASTPAGGNGSFTYLWLSSTTSATTGFAATSGTNDTSGYAPGALTTSTWFRRAVVSGTCGADTTAAVKVTITSPVSNNSITSGTQSICSGSTSTALTASTPAGGNGSFTYLWLSSTTSATTGFAAASGTNDTSGYAPGALTTSTWFRRAVVSGTCGADTTVAIKVTITSPVSNNSITSGTQSICSGSTPTALTASTPAGGNGSFTYLWLSSTTSATIGFAAASGTNDTSGYAPGALTTSTWFRRAVVSGTCGADTTVAIAVSVSTAGTWTGISGSAWNNAANWSCPLVPGGSTNVVIPSGTANSPVITDAQQVNNITINTGATLTLNNANAALNVFGSITNNGTFVHTLGKMSLSGTAAQTLPAGTYGKIEINNGTGITLGGNVTLNDSLILTNGVVALSGYNLILSNTAFTGVGSGSSYLRTNGTGHVTLQNVGTGGKAGNVSIPAGNSSYNPVVLNNAGTADDFSIWVIDSVTDAYSGNVPSGTKFTSNAVNRTWIINEAVAGGSNATVTLQWNAMDELSGFSRAACYMAHYNGTAWNNGTTSAATGTNPYTQTMTAISNFSPFGVGSNGVLPVELLGFSGIQQQQNAVLTWSTASEKNASHFEVYVSLDGKNYMATSDKINAAGNTSHVSSYHFTDVNVFNRIAEAFYKLKSTDLDGSSTWSNTISVKKETSQAAVSVYPNPFQGILTLSLPSAENVTVVITSMIGETLVNETVSASNNTAVIKGLEHLKTGVYLITVTQNGITHTEKLIKN